jgi:ubiquinone/menaquinone biosynthesis C-methylase UbiE
MKIKPEWTVWLHNYRRRELCFIFSKCPEKLFKMGLELGAGDGFQSSLLTKYVSKLISTDYNPDILKKENNKSTEYRICDAEEVDDMFSKRQFDLAFSSNLLEHLPNPDRALKGIYEVLKDDGITVHVMPSPFWKLCHLLLYIPNICALALERVTEEGGFSKVLKKIKGATNNLEPDRRMEDLGNNPKTQRATRSFLYHLLVPEPHGVSKSNIEEFYAFSKHRWRKEFEKANLELVKIIKGPVGVYGFGLDRTRRFLEWLGVTTEYIYVATKRGNDSPYKQYFNP